jgi:hypothetical protein
MSNLVISQICPNIFVEKSKYILEYDISHLMTLPNSHLAVSCAVSPLNSSNMQEQCNVKL